jgi:hypothetical protein
MNKANQAQRLARKNHRLDDKQLLWIPAFRSLAQQPQSSWSYTMHPGIYSCEIEASF